MFVEQSPPVVRTRDTSRLLIQTVQRLSACLTIGEVQEVVRTASRKLCGSDGATFVLREGDLCYYADEDAISPLWKGKRFPLNACISGWVMTNRRPVSIQDIYSDDRIPHDAYRPTFVQSLVMVPVRHLDPIGAIGNYWKDHHVADSQEIEILQALADATAVALENVRVWSELEARVLERTANLQQALELSDGVVATLAHEVRNPLFAAQGLLELALRRLEKDETILMHQNISQAHASIIEGMHVVTAQLDAAKMRVGKLRARPSEVQPDRIIETLASTYRNLRNNERTELLVDIEPNLPVVRTDEHLLTQAIRNLVSNSLKFTDDGTITIGASAIPDAVRFFVSDTGIGIPREHHGRIFEEFSQVDDSQAGRVLGTGLGLPFVRKVATLLGGTIEMESEPGRGSMFALAIPA